MVKFHGTLSADSVYFRYLGPPSSASASNING